MIRVFGKTIEQMYYNYKIDLRCYLYKPDKEDWNSVIF